MQTYNRPELFPLSKRLLIDATDVLAQNAFCSATPGAAQQLSVQLSQGRLPRPFGAHHISLQRPSGPVVVGREFSHHKLITAR